MLSRPYIITAGLFFRIVSINMILSIFRLEHINIFSFMFAPLSYHLFLQCVTEHNFK